MVKFSCSAKGNSVGITRTLQGFKLRYTGLSIDRFSLHRQVGHRPKLFPPYLDQGCSVTRLHGDLHILLLEVDLVVQMQDNTHRREMISCVRYAAQGMWDCSSSSGFRDLFGSCE